MWNVTPLTTFRGQKLNTIFFSTFSGTAGYPSKIPGISRQKNLIPLVSRDIPNFLAPTPSRGRPLPHRKISGLESLGLCSFSFLNFVDKLTLILAAFCALFGVQKVSWKDHVETTEHETPAWSWCGQQETAETKRRKTKARGLLLQQSCELCTIW